MDDPRNTDNAWMETVAMSFHDDSKLVHQVNGPYTGLGRFPLSAGDDAQAVQWKDIDSSLKLYASHKEFVEKTAKWLDAHWC